MGDALAKDAVAAAAPTGLLLPPVVVLGAEAALWCATPPVV